MVGAVFFSTAAASIAQAATWQGVEPG